MKTFAIVIITVSALVLATSATAYVGPGAAVTLLGALWAVIAAVVLAVVAILILPFKLMMRYMRAKASADANSREQTKKEPTAGDDTSAP